MLQLQLKNRVALKLSKKVTFFLKLFLGCCFVHMIIVVLLFFMTQSRMPILINTQSNDAPVSFIPFLKVAPPPAKQSLLQSPVSKKKVISKKVVQEKKAKPQAAATQLVKKATALPANKNVPIAAKKKSVAPSLTKKNVDKKIVPAVQEKKSVAKASEKTIPPKVVDEPKDLQTRISESTVSEAQETVVVGNEERELFVMHTTLKKDIIKKWKRPTNIPETALCQFRVIVHKNGYRDVMLEKSSNAMALDISARNFLLTYDFPEQWVEKELLILF